jgi:hypothetical protein
MNAGLTPHSLLSLFGPQEQLSGCMVGAGVADQDVVISNETIQTIIN